MKTRRRKQLSLERSDKAAAAAITVHRKKIPPALTYVAAATTSSTRREAIMDRSRASAAGRCRVCRPASNFAVVTEASITRHVRHRLERCAVHYLVDCPVRRLPFSSSVITSARPMLPSSRRIRTTLSIHVY